MKKAKKLKSDKAQTGCTKKYVRKFRIYPAFLYHRLDKWLKKMSINGLHIVDCGLFSFLFESGEKSEKEYFTYGLSSQEGKYNIQLRYPNLEEVFGLKKEKSKINSSKSKGYQIVEIDTERIDVKNDVSYIELINDRNRLYLRYFIRNLGVFLTIGIFLIVLLLLK